MQNTALSPVHTASDMITFVFNRELATSGDSNRWRQNVGVSSDAVNFMQMNHGFHKRQPIGVKNPSAALVNATVVSQSLKT